MTDYLLSTADLVRELYRRGLIIGETALRTYEALGLIPVARRLGRQRVWQADDLDQIEGFVRARRARTLDGTS